MRDAAADGGCAGCPRAKGDIEMSELLDAVIAHARSTRNAYKWKEEVQWLTW